MERGRRRVEEKRVGEGEGRRGGEGVDIRSVKRQRNVTLSYSYLSSTCLEMGPEAVVMRTVAASELCQ